MRRESGITLMTLITYIIVLLFVISAVTLITTFLMNNMNAMQDNNKSIYHINKFDLAFLEDVKQEKVSLYQEVTEGQNIIFEYPDGKTVEYIYQTGNIYRIESKNNQEIGKIKISEQIKENFTIHTSGDQIDIIIGAGEYQIEKHYKLGK